MERRYYLKTNDANISTLEGGCTLHRESLRSEFFVVLPERKGS